jgi:hypothetical protein
VSAATIVPIRRCRVSAVFASSTEMIQRDWLLYDSFSNAAWAAGAAASAPATSPNPGLPRPVSIR